jgi:hypothetical protein
MDEAARSAVSDHTGLDAWSTMMVGAASEERRAMRPALAVDIGATIACVVFALGLVVLASPIPGSHFTFDALVMHRVHGVVATLPPLFRQVHGPSDEATFLVLAAAAVGLWFGAVKCGRERVLLGLVACVAAAAIAGGVRHVDHVSTRAALLAIGTVVAFSAERRAGPVFLVFALAACIAGVAFDGRLPSEVVCGALLGTATILVMFRLNRLWQSAIARAVAFTEAHPGISAAFAFVLLAEFVQHVHELSLFASLALTTKLFH